MDFEQAENHYHRLRTRLEAGDLVEDAFRIEVAKLLFRDEHGVFWMLDADKGTWVCNRGDGWTPGDPRVARAVDEPATPERHRPRRSRWTLALGAVAIVVLGLGGALAWRTWFVPRGATSSQVTTEMPQVRVVIASPSNGSQVALGQEVAIESTIRAAPDFATVDHVELVVNSERLDRQPVQPKVQPGQSAIPFSQPWLPTKPGKYQVAVVAFSADNDPLGVAAITLLVEEAPDLPILEPACLPGATFVTDVTIPSGTAFPPDVRMDKVWQVRNSGSCAWGMGYELVLIEGESLGAPNAVPAPPTPAGARTDVTVTFWSPKQAGRYRSVWQLQSPNSEFFGPPLVLDIQVEALAQESSPPDTPTDLHAAVSADGKTVQLTWTDRSNNEDAFRIYREGVEASIGLAPTDATLFIDGNVACGNTYRYTVVAFNAAGPSSLSDFAELTLPSCAPSDQPPIISLTIVPTEVKPSAFFTITFEASDDQSLALVAIRGEGTEVAILDEGRTFPCAGPTCLGNWSVNAELLVQGESVTEPITTTLVLVAIAQDTSGQESEQAEASVIVLPPD